MPANCLKVKRVKGWTGCLQGDNSCPPEDDGDGYTPFAKGLDKLSY